MILKYKDFVLEYNDFEKNEDYGYYNEYEYEIDEDMIIRALFKILKDKSYNKLLTINEKKAYKLGFDTVINLLSNSDMLNSFAENYEDELKDYFEKDARYENNI